MRHPSKLYNIPGLTWSCNIENGITFAMLEK